MVYEDMAAYIPASPNETWMGWHKCSWHIKQLHAQKKL